MPWRPWSTRERLEPGDERGEPNPCDVTVLIPARNEAAVIGARYRLSATQGPGLKVILVDDQSSDETASLALSNTCDRAAR